MRRVASHLAPHDELALVAWKEQVLLMADRRAETFGFRRDSNAQWADALAWQGAAPAGRWILVDAAALAPCVDRARAIDVGRSNRRGWWLVPAAATSACR
jgi:hypothetical protein